MQLPIAQSDYSQHFSRRVRLWLAFGAGLITSSLLIFIVLLAPSGPIGSLSLFVTWLISVLLPLIMAVRAALMTSMYIRHESYKVACGSDLSNWQLALSLVRRVLDTHRNLLIFLIGLAPLWMVLAMLPNGVSCAEACSHFWLLGSPLNDGIVAIPAFINAVLLTVLAIWSGVWLGLRFQQTRWAAVVAFALNSILAIILIRLDGVIIAFPVYPFSPSPLPSVLVGVVGIYIVVPLIILVVITFFAAQSARKAHRFSPLI
jgi:hypothetical protein